MPDPNPLSCFPPRIPPDPFPPKPPDPATLPGAIKPEGLLPPKLPDTGLLLNPSNPPVLESSKLPGNRPPLKPPLEFRPPLPASKPFRFPPRPAPPAPGVLALLATPNPGNLPRPPVPPLPMPAWPAPRRGNCFPPLGAWLATSSPALLETPFPVMVSTGDWQLSQLSLTTLPTRGCCCSKLGNV